MKKGTRKLEPTTMTNETKIFPITVNYWLGPLQQTGKASTVKGDLRIANRNRNAFDPSFYSADGRKMFRLSFDKSEGLGIEGENVIYA